MPAFDQLRPEIKNYIWDQQWPALRQIQEAAIQHAGSSEDNLILAAPTASGKTEAAFLPAINGVDDWSTGVKVVYISPLIALINDQFKRVTELCEYLGIPVTSWHGEASKAKKNQLLKQPKGIVLITPESIEALLIRHPEQAKQLFFETEYVVLDELHSFLDSRRGVHLQSLLARLRRISKKTPRYFGLSATLSRESYAFAKTFFGTNQKTTVLVDTARNELTVTLQHHKTDKSNVPAAIIDDIYERSRRERMLVFPNSRGRVEEVAVRLQRRANRDQSMVKYFAHHASVDKELRLEAESFAKAATDELFTICCTSTLELGIDIGAVDSISQIEATFSVASLAQRLGRSGRHDLHSRLQLYTTTEWSLLQTIACTELFKMGQIEQITPLDKPFDVLFQQILSILLEQHSLSRYEILSQIQITPCWSHITHEESELLLDHMVLTGMLEDVDGELIVGSAAERIIESRGFYAHFEDKQEYRVLNDAQHIGDMPHSLMIGPGSNVFLAARIWKITAIDDETKKIFVIPAKDGKPPVYGGEGGAVSHLVRQTMRAILGQLSTLPEYADAVVVRSVLRDVSRARGITEGEAGNML